jgi:hypothetical protein
MQSLPSICSSGNNSLCFKNAKSDLEFHGCLTPCAPQKFDPTLKWLAFPEPETSEGRLSIPKTGQQGSVGLVVTKTLVILVDPLVTTTPEHPRGAMLRAYDGHRATKSESSGCQLLKADRP